MGRPNSIIKHTGHARVPTETKGQSQVELGTKPGKEVKSRANVIATKGNCVPKVQFSGPGEGDRPLGSVGYSYKHRMGCVY